MIQMKNISVSSGLKRISNKLEVGILLCKIQYLLVGMVALRASKRNINAYL